MFSGTGTEVSWGGWAAPALCVSEDRGFISWILKTMQTSHLHLTVLY